VCFSPSLSLSDDSLPCPVLAVFCVFCGVLASAFASASPTTTPTAAAQPASREVGHIQRQSAKPGVGRCSTSIILFHCSPLCCPHEEHAHLSLLHIPYYSLCSASFFPCMFRESILSFPILQASPLSAELPDHRLFHFAGPPPRPHQPVGIRTHFTLVML